MRMRHATRADLPTLKLLWERCFGDEQSYIDFYFTHGFQEAQTLVLEVQHQVVSMLTLLPVVLRHKDTVLQGSYVYAVATDSDCQGKGYMRQLMDYAEQVALQQQDDFLCLVPANAPLFTMYGKLGYQTVTAMKRCLLLPQSETAVTIMPLTKQAYFNKRHTWLSQMGDTVQFSDEAYLMQEMDCTGTVTLQVETPSQSGILAGYVDKDVFVVRETSLDEANLQRTVSSLCAQFDTKSVTAKLPFGEVPYAMAKALKAEGAIHDCYMNLMLD